MSATPNYPPVPPSPNASATATPSPAPAGDLAATGGPDLIVWLMLLGALLIVAGVTAWAVRRSEVRDG